MKIEIDIDSNEFKENIGKTFMSSKLIQEQIKQILEDDVRITEILKEKVTEIIKSDEMTDVIKERIESYINDDYCVDCDVVDEVLSEYVKNFIISRFNINQGE